MIPLAIQKNDANYQGCAQDSQADLTNEFHNMKIILEPELEMDVGLLNGDLCLWLAAIY